MNFRDDDETSKHFAKHWLVRRKITHKKRVCSTKLNISAILNIKKYQGKYIGYSHPSKYTHMVKYFLNSKFGNQQKKK